MAEFTVERWRVVVVALATIAALPLFVLEDPDSTGSLTGVADASSSVELALSVPIVLVDAVAAGPVSDWTTPTSPADITNLVDRADEWHVARSNLPTVNRLAEAARMYEAEAIAMAQEIVAVEFAEREALDAILAAKQVEADRQAERARLREEEDNRRATAISTPGPTTTIPWDTKPADGGPSAEQWEALRYCEATGDYTAVNPTGRYRGAYQFSTTTWDWIAGIYHERLVGVDPAAAAPADQDAMARSLYNLRGRGQWPVCGRYLP
ncbi:MAG TPA: transglycosylase family protein [Acidimicrobiales bacterium]|nr:transglycosylase family protein [Acidimicrobiales bacterium]MDP6214727.1 transglycosylase family protein [Acidimicrobiales bacterium]MDP7208300.1 transglycosylase family protein [Acidimicrobiales bacterium]HJL90336.1 transglycosylase family protein [Acidimicrobiales bacterium]HJO98785.1 transglycosylase family protein [Acidimicrobiales bacterium]